jgi:hypothetical protein
MNHDLLIFWMYVFLHNDNAPKNLNSVC